MSETPGADAVPTTSTASATGAVGADRRHPRGGGQAGPRRPRPRRQGRRARAARRRHGGHLHRPAPDPRADRRGRHPGGRRRRRALHPVRRPHDPVRRAWSSCSRERDASDIVVFGGGIIPEDDIAAAQGARRRQDLHPGRDDDRDRRLGPRATSTPPDRRGEPRPAPVPVLSPAAALRASPQPYARTSRSAGGSGAGDFVRQAARDPAVHRPSCHGPHRPQPPRLDWRATICPGRDRSPCDSSSSPPGSLRAADARAPASTGGRWPLCRRVFTGSPRGGTASRRPSRTSREAHALPPPRSPAHEGAAVVSHPRHCPARAATTAWTSAPSHLTRPRPLERRVPHASSRRSGPASIHGLLLHREQSREFSGRRAAFWSGHHRRPFAWWARRRRRPARRASRGSPLVTADAALGRGLLTAEPSPGPSPSSRVTLAWARCVPPSGHADGRHESPGETRRHTCCAAWATTSSRSRGQGRGRTDRADFRIRAPGSSSSSTAAVKYARGRPVPLRGERVRTRCVARDGWSSGHVVRTRQTGDGHGCALEALRRPPAAETAHRGAATSTRGRPRA